MKTTHRIYALLCVCLCLTLAASVGCAALPDYCHNNVEQLQMAASPPDAWQASPPVSDYLAQVFSPRSEEAQTERQRLLTAINAAENLTFQEETAPELRKQWLDSLLVKLGKLQKHDSPFRERSCDDEQAVLRFALAAAYESHLDKQSPLSQLCTLTLAAVRGHGGISGNEYWERVCDSIEASVPPPRSV